MGGLNINTNLDIISAFEIAVKKYCDRVALRDKYGEISYSELLDLVDRKACSLKKQSFWHKDIYVAIDLPKTRMSIIIMLAVYKAEGVVIPLPVECPIDRVNNIIAQTKSEIVITDRQIKYNALCLDPYSLDDLFEPGVIEHSNRSNSLAYIIFTSGSTGEPKGVMIRQKSIINEVEACYKRFFDLDDGLGVKELEKPLVIAILADFSFDPSMVQLYTGLFYGNCIVPVPADVKKSQWKLSEYLSEMKVDCLDITPSHLKYVLSFYENKKEEIYLPRNIISVGEPLTSDFLKKIREFKKVEYVINAYGPTEVCVYCTAVRFKLDKFYDVDDVMVGSSLDGYEIYILDEKGNKVECGQIGEICVASPYISDGYIGKEELTKKSFVRLPDISEYRIYKTNDLGYTDKDGYFYCKGRRDDQIKIAGNRIEIGEVENTIKRYVNVQQIKIIVANDSLVGKKLIAFYSGDEKNESEFRNELKKFLPNPMIPTAFIRIEKFPLNNNGKIDRKKLLDAYKTNVEVSVDSSVEGIIAKILNLSNVSFDDNFFDLGATSLNMLIFSSEIYNKYGVMIDNERLKQCYNIREIIDYINALVEKTSINEFDGNASELCNDFVNKIIRNEIKERIKNKNHTKYSIYNVIFKLTSTERFNENIIVENIKELAKRHRILRSRFVMREHEMYLESTDDSDIDFTHVLSKDSVALSDVIKDFQYDKVPLYQVIMVDKDDDKQELIFNFHHSIADQISVEIYINELLRLYNGYGLPFNKVDYFEYKDQCKALLCGETKAFWEEYLKDRNKAVGFYGSGTNKRYRVNVDEIYNNSKIVLDGSIYKDIKRLIKKYNMNAFSLFALCIAYSLYKETGEKDVILGSILHGRIDNISGSSNVIGMLAKLLPIRFKFDENDILDAVLENINLNIGNVIANQNIDLTDIYSMQSFEDRIKGEFFRIIINYNEGCRVNSGVFDDKIEIEEIGENMGSIPIYLYILKKQERFILDFKYATSIYTEKDIEAIQIKYISVINDFLLNN